jgi:hypothetical protein
MRPWTVAATIPAFSKGKPDRDQQTKELVWWNSNTRKFVAELLGEDAPTLQD